MQNRLVCKHNKRNVPNKMSQYELVQPANPLQHNYHSHRALSIVILPCPKVTKLPPMYPPNVPKRLPRTPQNHQTTRKQLELQSKCTNKYRTTMKYGINLLTCTQRPWPEVQSQRSKDKCPRSKVQGSRSSLPATGLQLCPDKREANARSRISQSTKQKNTHTHTHPEPIRKIRPPTACLENTGVYRYM